VPKDLSVNLNFFARPGCHLCEDAAPIVDQVAARLGLGVTEVNIDLDPETAVDWGLRIPVVCWPDGTVLGEGNIESRALLRAVRSKMRMMSPPRSG
jgi:thiol-disulfide isomerase/thioredoxin